MSEDVYRTDEIVVFTCNNNSDNNQKTHNAWQFILHP